MSDPTAQQNLPPTPVERLDAGKAARLYQALTAGHDELFAYLDDTDPEVAANVLRNPGLSEDHLLALLKRRNLPESLVKALARHPLVTGSRRLTIAVAAHPSTPAHVLSSILPQLFLFELVALLHIPGAPADMKYAVERVILAKIPETELGNKITLARRGTAAILDALIKGGDPRLVEAVLDNPKLKEATLYTFLGSGAATAETISAIARHPRWKSRPNLRTALLKNRKTPIVWFHMLLSGLPASELQALSLARHLTPQQQAVIREECNKRGVRKL
ncbi:hypothetical protein GMSM_14950 [Geomonas sp. Red276]